MRTAKTLFAMIWICMVLLATLSVGLLGLPLLARAKDATGINEIVDNFKTSLHATRKGMDTYYSNPISPYDLSMGGFVNLTGVWYDDLSCKNCHDPAYADAVNYEPSCGDCHVDKGPVADSTCRGCHSRQVLEETLFSDVHRDRGLGCTDCHTMSEMHGDGNDYTSLQEPGALKVKCQRCHPVNQLKPNKFHKHVATVDCTACHVKSVIACNSCHFESLLEGKQRPYALPMQGFKMLMRNEEGMVQSASFQTLTVGGLGGQSFYVLAPYATHSITTDIKCTDCHLQGPKGGKAVGAPKNSPINEYVETGKITVTRWDGASLIGAKGVIPVPPDWKEALQFDFVYYTGDPAGPVDMDPSKWSYQKTGADMLDMPFGQPLTEGQMWHLIHSR
jgi:hypothetical protein